MSSDPTPLDSTLHVYAQPAWHADAFLVGTRSALTALRDALTAVLHQAAWRETLPQTREMDSFTADGEGYRLSIVCETEETMERYALPYTDEMARENDLRRQWPHRKEPQP